MSKSKEILISLLTYNSTNVIENCLNSLKNQTNQNFKCFIFDNDSNDGIEDFVKKYPEIKFIQVGKNEGYTGGHNFALEYFRKNYPNHKYMMVLNPDIICSNNLIEEFQNLFEKNVTLYTCALKKSSYDKRLWVNKNIHLPSFTFLGRYLKQSEFNHGYIQSMFVSGSCFVIDIEKYKNKYLFKDYFMYHDEIELSLRLKLQGKKIITATNAYVVHEPKKQNFLNEKSIYLLELNRLKLQSDLFSNTFVLLNLPFYIFFRLVIFLIFRPMTQAKEYSRGLNDGLKYFQNNLGIKKASFKKTLEFLFLENSKF